MNQIAAPSFLTFATEPLRAPVELAVDYGVQKCSAAVRAGFEGFARVMDTLSPPPVPSERQIETREKDKRPIIPIPGFCGPNWTMNGVHTASKNAGHPTYAIDDLWANWAGKREVNLLLDTIRRAADRHSQAPILIEHSAGGLVGMAAAYLEPDSVHSMYAMGTPFGKAMGRKGANTVLSSLHTAIHMFDTSNVAAELQEHMQGGPPKAKLVALRSQWDGVVAPEAAMHPWEGEEGTITFNWASHCALPGKTKVLTAIMNRIAAGENAVDTSRRPRGQVIDLDSHRPGVPEIPEAALALA